MLIIDRKGFRVMAILHRTYRVTRLRVIYLLNTRQGVWEKITEKVSDTEKFRTAESYRRERSSDKFRWYRKVVSGYTIKSNWFRHMPDNSWRMPESFWKLFGIFWDKNRKCSGAAGATSDAFRRWKSLKPELFRNALKIILVGTGNVLSPHKYFQFDQTLKNVVVNSENQLYGYFMESHLLGLCSKRSWGWHGWIGAIFGPLMGVWPATWGIPPWGPSCSLVSLLGPCGRTSFMCILGFLWNYPTPLGFPINRGGGAALHTHPLLSYTCHALSGFFSPSHEKSFVEP